MPNDSWNPELYSQKHSFVFEYGRGLVSLLDPQPGERILDLGCGTGQLTAAIAEAGARVVGLDNSRGMIEQARERFPELEFVSGDAADFSFPEPFDAVFSNAVLHWVLDAEGAVRRISATLRPGGRFVAELGGSGNVRRIAEALREALRDEGRPGESVWWYFPTVGEYASLLEAHGFEVSFATLYDRPTKLEEGEAGLRNWLEMFKGEVLAELDAHAKQRVLSSVENSSRGALFSDGSWHADYRRLRVVAFKL